MTRAAITDAAAQLLLTARYHSRRPFGDGAPAYRPAGGADAVYLFLGPDATEAFAFWLDNGDGFVRRAIARFTRFNEDAPES